jgi:hypothetical protein
MYESTTRDTVSRVCSWCGKSMGLVTGRSFYRYPVTHGMCGACSHILSAFRDLPLDRLINQLGGPIMVVDELSSLVVTANEEAAEAFGKTVEEMAGQRGGNVMECVHTHEPGGCGRAEHCTGCTIRQLVIRTAASGDGVEQAAAFQYRVTPGGIRKQLYLISTEKMEDLVLLRIEPRSAVKDDRAEQP